MIGPPLTGRTNEYSNEENFKKRQNSECILYSLETHHIPLSIHKVVKSVI